MVGNVSANVYDATSDSKRTRWAASLHPTPYALSSRSSACDMMLTRILARSARDDAVEDSKQGCGRGPSSENDAGLGDAALYALVELMFAGGRDSSVVLGGEPACDAPTVGLCERLKAQVAQVYKDRASDICRSPERPDLRLSKEEAQGHAMGSLVIGELLESEARRVGKDIDNVCAKEAAMVKRQNIQRRRAGRRGRPLRTQRLQQRRWQRWMPRWSWRVLNACVRRSCSPTFRRAGPSSSLRLRHAPTGVSRVRSSTRRRIIWHGCRSRQQ